MNVRGGASVFAARLAGLSFIASGKFASFFIADHEGYGASLRYVDDFLVFGDSKEE